MKELFLEMFKGLLIGMCFVLFCFVIASLSRSAYAVDLSKSQSVTPERHSGFFVPQICIGSQSVHLYGTSVSATQTRLQSLYGRMTRQNKPMVNMSGGTLSPRVNPPTLISQIMVDLKSSKLKGGNHHA